ncbi:CDGSH iron-sulfur domain-containing protein 1 isoform X1 [Chelonia mydas]|uniref:CDGSH iron-sulfur domain-containing protein 1 isoform X1 n=1 Tax=Chelonia mydas TaxID=8469 RepID=UPI001CA9D438|nr:CDGSH iron-sulfur domain-containing protein 1 isoform X1 [Chelonia mydas]
MGLGSNSSVRVEWVAAISLAAGAAAVGYLAYTRFLSKDKCCKAMVNLHIQKDNPKVVHAFDMEDLGDKAVYCRCWRSKKVKRIHQVEMELVFKNELGEVPGTGPTLLSQNDGIVTFHSKHAGKGAS